MCRVLSVSRSGYYEWRRREPNQQTVENERLLGSIREIHVASLESYGVPRIYKALRVRGHVVNRKRVERLMRMNQIQGTSPRRKWVRTTDSNHELPVAANILNRNFHANKPNQKWVADITYIPTDEGWLYLATVLDLFSRKIVGWSMTDTLETPLVLRALKMAIITRQPDAGLLHHSDRGSQYASHEYQALLKQFQVQPSMSRTGNCYDNAVMESFFGTIKSELIRQRHYRTKAEARTDIFRYIETFYNRQRIHSTLGYLSPDDFEVAYMTESLS